MAGLFVFRPRKSFGWAWLGGLGLVLIALGLPTLPLASIDETSRWVVIGTAAFCLLLGVPFLVLAAWFPTMRYELAVDSLTLRYGPVLTYRIPLDEIQAIRRRDLAISLWSSLRLPGISLFSVPYADVGTVKMCATAAARGILLIETGREKYGLTPADELALVTALQERMAP